MDRKRILKHLVWLMFFIFIVNSISWQFSWYYSIWYLDAIMHFLGGFWVGLFFVYFFFKKDPVDLNSRFFFKIFTAVLAVGVLWEFYEFYLNIISLTSFDLPDTVFDVFFDLLGMLVLFFPFLKNNYVRTLK